MSKASAPTSSLSGFKKAVKSRHPRLWESLQDARSGLRPYLNKTRFQARKTRFGVEAIRNLFLDFRYGGYCGGRIPTRFAHLDAHGTSSADYYQLARLFDGAHGGIGILPDDVLVDVGSGKGRVVNFWLHHGVRSHIYALELDERFAGPAATRLRRYGNVTVRCGDAIELLPEDGTLFFLFNPFGEETMRKFKQRAAEIATRNPTFRIVYNKCDVIGVFENDPQWSIERLNGFFYPAALIRFRG